MVGKPYEVAIRLHAIAGDNWREFDGWCVSRGVNPLRLTPARFCNLIYFWIVKRIDPDKREEFEAMLTSPIPGRERRSELLDDADGEAFMAMMQQVNG